MKKYSLEDLAYEFEVSLKRLNRQPLTIKEKRRKLSKFFIFLKPLEITQIEQVTPDVLKAYRVNLYQQVNANERQNSVAYQNLMIGAVKQFMEFLYHEGYLVSNPAKNIAYAKEPSKLPSSILTLAEARKILKMPDTKSIIGYRDKTILEIFYSSGIRKSELMNLTLLDVDYHEGLLKVMGKGRKERIVPIGRIACRYLENYITSVRSELLKEPAIPYVFLSCRGNRLNPNALWMMVKKYARKAGIKKNIHCHTFRHTCATSMLKNKADIRVIQELLGHESLESTQIYTRIAITDLKEIHGQCHPRERDKL